MDGDNEPDIDGNAGETSKAGLRRMRRLANEVPHLRSNPRGAIHPSTSTLIYPTPSSTNTQGYLTSSIFSSSHPKRLTFPSILPPGEQISTSPDGQWTTVFHATPTADTRGTLAIYNSDQLLSPTSISNTIIPLSTFALPSPPISIPHLYPPRTHLTSSRSRSAGPNPLDVNYELENGPSFIVLLETSLLYFYPTPVLNGQITSWTMTYLTSPIHRRYHIASNSADGFTPEGFRIRRGWTGLIPNNTGIWVGWEDEVGERGVGRVEVGRDKFGKIYLQCIPMPTLPRVEKIPFAENGEEYREELQSVVFVSLHHEDSTGFKKEKINGMQVDGDGDGSNKKDEKDVERVGAVLIFNDTSFTSSSSACRTRIQVHSFERREIELAQGFNDISSGNGEMVSSWDWSTVPRPVHHYASPTNTSILALHPLSSLPPYSLALAIISQPSGLSLIHLNLLADQWTTVGDPIDLDELRGEVDLGLVVSQGVSRGQSGLVAVIGKEAAPALVVVPRLDGQPTLAEPSTESSLAVDAATSIILAEKDGVDWSDVMRSAIGATGVGKRKDLIAEISEQTYKLSMDQVDIDELGLLLRVQIALFSLTDDPRLDLASDILRLKEASNLVDRCAIFEEDGKITFDLDSIWPLIGLMEWSINHISTSMRELILLGAQMEYSASDDIDLEQPSSTIILLQLGYRQLVIKLLSQLNTLIGFLDRLDRPILQPESKVLPAPLKRDAMATIIARDRIRDVAYANGVDLMQWGKALEGLSTRDIPQDTLNNCLYTLSLVPLKDHLPKIIENLPNSSDLFLSNTSTSQVYDSITYLPLSSSSDSRVKCERCEGMTEELGSLSVMGGNSGRGDISPWLGWKEGFKRCLCGGNWVRWVSK
ncbi:hypothetical protein I302_101407 [Kwoniella bestiolae CBS 10118]|uniref:Mediator complex subunit 16 n=1 Tax=Kwoniella bestiolae CBS 10118 TaxID=1296100 RepID=A0A1B9GC47_9TREE|nr:hypothetical protein I302_00088 [Kwoniella bestiolae CBS 10118]OCF28600.1 hypothetical protein I302_00088 [Kwoniella bestiolae CBS 10118]